MRPANTSESREEVCLSMTVLDNFADGYEGLTDSPKVGTKEAISQGA